MPRQITDFSADTLVCRGVLSSDTVATNSRDILAGAGALDPNAAQSLISNAGAVAVTLADAAQEGTTKVIICTAATAASTVTPANFANGTTISFDAAGEACSLIFVGGTWYLAAGPQGATVA